MKSRIASLFSRTGLDRGKPRPPGPQPGEPASREPMADSGRSNKADQESGVATEARQDAEDAASRLPSLLIDARYIASTVAPGVHGRRRVGSGESFWQFRRYAHGDALSRIDWRQSGKSRHVFVREYEWEASQTIVLWRDPSRSMSYRSANSLPTKLYRTDVLVIALAILLNRSGERVAMLGNKAPPSSGRLNLELFLETLRNVESLDEAALASVPRHASAVLIGDFLNDPDALEKTISTLAARSVHGHLLQVLDPAEATLPFTGRIRFRDVDHQPSETLIPRVQGIRGAYLQRLAERQDRLADAARHCGWTFGVHRTDHSAQSGLLYLYGALSGDPAMTVR